MKRNDTGAVALSWANGSEDHHRIDSQEFENANTPPWTTGDEIKAMPAVKQLMSAWTKLSFP